MTVRLQRTAGKIYVVRAERRSRSHDEFAAVGDHDAVADRTEQTAVQRQRRRSSGNRQRVAHGKRTARSRTERVVAARHVHRFCLFRADDGNRGRRRFARRERHRVSVRKGRIRHGARRVVVLPSRVRIPRTRFTRPGQIINRSSRQRERLGV